MLNDKKIVPLAISCLDYLFKIEADFEHLDIKTLIAITDNLINLQSEKLPLKNAETSIRIINLVMQFMKTKNTKPGMKEHIKDLETQIDNLLQTAASRQQHDIINAFSVTKGTIGSLIQSLMQNPETCLNTYDGFGVSHSRQLIYSKVQKFDISLESLSQMQLVNLLTSCLNESDPT